jgi:drug/metabolite transporter (DMT)-like permease
MTYVVALLCVLGIAIGQILFKLSAIALKDSGSFFDFKTGALLLSAFVWYGLTTIAWVWVLQKSDLGKIYPLMALAFLLVPLGSWVFLGERFSPQYFIGVALIVSGIVITVKS